MGAEHTRAVLALLALPRIGRKTARKILAGSDDFPTSQKAMLASLKQAKSQHARIPEANVDSISAAFRSADAIAEDCKRRSIQIHLVQDRYGPNWISKVRSIPDAPVLLFSLGDSDALSGPCVTIIGTRKPTPWGKAASKRISGRSVDHGFCVVSGLATGCDIAAHQGAIEAGGKTVAVLAHGLDTIHPEHHAILADQIATQSGCLLSEYAPGTRPQRGSFVERDRLQSALGAGVIVVETGIKGGTNHTVSFAKLQGRPIGCLIHPEKYASIESVQGNKIIIADGAFPISAKDDLSEFLTCYSGKDTRIDSAAEGSSPEYQQPRQDSLF